MFLPLLTALLLINYSTGVPAASTQHDHGHVQAERLSKFKLYTRQTVNEGQEVLPNSESLGKSAFNPLNNVTIFAHGYLGSGWNWYIHDLKNALLTKYDINYLVVDWSEGSVDWLPDAYEKAKIAAKETSSFITLFKEIYKMPMASLHLIGHSMGGRVVALAVETFKDPLVGRITALDPLPGKYKGLATFTDVIHTTFLADDAEADADFWPNNLDIGGDIPWVSPHMYAVYMYTMSVSRCDFVAHECSSWEKYQDGECSGNPESRMGHHAVRYPGRGKMFLQIKPEPPFC